MTLLILLLLCSGWPWPDGTRDTPWMMEQYLFKVVAGHKGILVPPPGEFCGGFLGFGGLD